MISADEAQDQLLVLWEKNDWLRPAEEMIELAVLGAISRGQTETNISVTVERLACTCSVLKLFGYETIERHTSRVDPEKIVVMFSW